MLCFLLVCLTVLLCVPPGRSLATPEVEFLDEPELLSMLSGGSGESFPATAVAPEYSTQVYAMTATRQGRLFGEKTILVVRIETLDGNANYCDEDCGWKLMFGPELQFGLQPTLDAATREASYGQMFFNKSKSAVVTVQIPEREFALPCNFPVAGKYARMLVQQLHGKDPDSFDFVYHFLPTSMTGCPGGAGVAFVGGRHAFSTPGGTKNGIIKHELGHNFGLHHARALGSSGEEDGWDTGTSMGGGVIIGTAERYMLGWISGDAVRDLGEIQNGKDPDLPGDPRLRAYWDRGSCGPQGDDFNWGWCGHLRGDCPESKAVSKDVCESGSAKLHFMSKRDAFSHQGCQFFWFAQYACTGSTTTTTTTTTTVPEDVHDVLLEIAAARHPLNTSHGPHAVIFSLWKDAVFALSYRTPHGTDGASMNILPDRFSWVVDHKVNIHRLRSGRPAAGRGFQPGVLYAGVGDGERFTLGRSPVSHRGNFTLEVCSANEDQAIVSISFHAGSHMRSKCHSATSTTSRTTTTTTAAIATTSTVATTITTTSSQTIDTSIRSGDTIFLRTRSGSGNMVDIESSAVQARWTSHGSWQAITIEKKTGGRVNSGDVVFLKTNTGAHIDVSDEMVRARWNDWGSWQAMVIEKRTGNGAILPDDIVCFRAHTGQHLDVEGAVVQARWNDCGDWQAMRIEREVSSAVFSGSSIHLLAHTGNRIDVDGTAVRARWTDAGAWQSFVIENYGGRAIFSGDAVFLKAHTGRMVDVDGVAVEARWSEKGDWQKLFIEKKDGCGAILPGDTVFLKTHTGKMIEVEGKAVQARFSEKGSWQAFTIEDAAPRRLAASTVRTPALGTLCSKSDALLAVVVVTIMLVAMPALVCCSPKMSGKVQPEEQV